MSKEPKLIENVASCPVCGQGHLNTAYKYDDFDVLYCKACDASWRSNMYSESDIADLYSADEYAAHPYFQAGGEIDVLDRKRRENYRRALHELATMIEGRCLLDVGSGSGNFIAIARQHGWEVEGVELSPGLAERCRQATGAKVLTSTFEEAKIELRSYDVATFWDIIEHVRDPMLCLNKARQILKPGGVALFCTPNESSLLARLGKLLYSAGYRYPSYALHPTNHTFFFRNSGFSRMLERAGFSVRQVYSQDAYFEHSPLATAVQKVGIRVIELLATPFDARYESVFIAQVPDR